MPYTSEKPTPRETPEQLRARIPGWGADLDPADRPSYPKEQFLPTGAHWDFPERQVEKWPRERSIEHAFVTPVFGTSTPPKGLSGVIRKYAYRRFSEARAAHWLLLIAADRVDTAESRVTALLQGKPDHLVAETGISAERSPVADRVGQKRADVGHHLLDPVIVAAPWVIGGGLAFSAVRALVRRRRG